jgi:c-di-GMP-binding flagellar brake protein YcgR
MFKERRKHVRIATNISIRFYKEDLDRKSRKKLSGIAENCSLGGMYLSTEDTFPEGSVLSLEFEIDSEESGPTVVKARAVVRWSRRWSAPRGMGLEFVEFEGPGNRSFAEWMAVLAKKAMETEK